MATQEDKIVQNTPEIEPGQAVSSNGSQQPDQGFVFTNEAQPSNLSPKSDVESVSWTASEFIFHEKTSGWYVALVGVSLVGSAVLYLLTRDLIAVGAVLFGALMFGVYAGRKPRQLPYQVDVNGVQVGQRSFGYGEFKAFSVVQEDAFSSIVLSPLKRFATLTTIYYPPEQEDKVIAIIANYLPMENREQDSIDKFMHKIGF